jgi:NADP-dependent 3-hydroxy acid dehydrogenase YdfG
MKKIALITGASSGIGKSIALNLNKNNYYTIICGRQIDKLEQTKSEMDAPEDCQILCFDVRDQKAVFKEISELSTSFPNIDVLINNAGNAHGLAKIADDEIENWDLMMDGNVKGLLYVTRAVLPFMEPHQNGHIINISSIAGKQTYENGVVYCASKKAVEAISEGLRLELTSKHIKVTNIAPGAVETNFSEVRFKGDTDRAKKVYEGFEPLKSEDIADLVWYVLSAPKHVCIADVTILPSQQAAASVIYRK